VGLTVLIAAFLHLHQIRAVEWLMVPAVFVFANGFEWLVHRNVLHTRIFWPFDEIYERHTPEHHAVYMTDDMAIRSWREFYLVLIPAAGGLGQAIVATPLAILCAKVLTPNCGWLFLVTSSLYMVGYELSHLSYHLPPTTLIGRNPLVKVLREHHARHHDPTLMQNWNFNVTIPIWDYLLGTVKKKR